LFDTFGFQFLLVFAYLLGGRLNRMPRNPIDIAEKLRIAKAIQKCLDQSDMTRRDLSGPNLSLSAVDKLFQGKFSDRTLDKVEGKLGKSFREKKEETEHQEADSRYGGYSRKSAVKKLCGDFVCVRPKFDGKSNLNAYVIRIAWNMAERCLGFEELFRADSQYTQNGVIHMPLGHSFFTLLSVDGEGDVRTIHVSLPGSDGICRGIVRCHWAASRCVPICAA
jgi:hypothetical protein